MFYQHYYAKKKKKKGCIWKKNENRAERLGGVKKNGSSFDYYPKLLTGTLAYRPSAESLAYHPPFRG